MIGSLRIPPTPALDKLSACSSDSQRIGEFVEWLQSKRIHWFNEPHCKKCNSSSIGLRGLFPDSRESFCRSCDSNDIGLRWGTMDAMLAEYFGVDLDAVERERRAMLDALRAKPEEL